MIAIAYQIYVFLADLYSGIMARFVRGGNQNLFQSSLILTAINTVYTLAAVLMLFRVVISLLSYLVEPDQVKDKTTGGGKLVTRIIIVILLILLTIPNGQQAGLLFRAIDDLQNSLLGRYDIEEGSTTWQNGVISRFFEKLSDNELISNSRVNADSSTSSEATSYNNNLSLVDTIYARTEWDELYGLYDLTGVSGESTNYAERLYGYNANQSFGGGVKCAGSDYAGKGKMQYQQSSDATDLALSVDMSINYFNTCEFTETTKEEILGRGKQIIDNEIATRTHDFLNEMDQDKYNNDMFTRACEDGDQQDTACYYYDVHYIVKTASNKEDRVMSGYQHNQISDVNYHLYLEAPDARGLRSPSLTVSITYVLEADQMATNIKCYYAAIKEKYNNPGGTHLAVAASVYVEFTRTSNSAAENGDLNKRPIRNGDTWHISKVQNEENVARINMTFYRDTSQRKEFYTNIAKLTAEDTCTGGKNITIDYRGLAKLRIGQCPSTITNVSCESPYEESQEGSQLDWTCSFCSVGSSKITQSDDINANTLQFGQSVSSVGSLDYVNPFDTWGTAMMNKTDSTANGGAFPDGYNNTISSALALASYNMRNMQESDSTTPDEGQDEGQGEAEAECAEYPAGTVEYSTCITGINVRNAIRANESEETTFIGNLFLAFVKSRDNRSLSQIEAVFTSNGILTNETALRKLESHDGVDIDVSAFMAIIIGLVAMVFFFVLAVDVVVRNCKLILLEIMSPIAILAYLNPRDKILGQWAKQFAATFVDLFLKLIAIQCIGLFVELLKTDSLFDIFITIGVLTFAKIVPDFISKIFGIKDAAGTFKDSFKMVKAAGFAAAGGAIAFGRGAVGMGQTYHATKGQSKGNRFLAGAQGFGTLMSSTLRGMGGGSKGNLTAGWQHASNMASKRVAQYESGVTAGAAMLAGLTMGLYNPNHKDEQIEQAYDDILTKRKALDERMEKQILEEKDLYRADASSLGINGLTSNMSMKQLQNFKNSDAYHGLSSKDAAAFDKFYADNMNESKATYLQDVLSGKIDDVQTKSNAETYDRTVEAYKNKYGKKEASQKQGSDQDYKYDFESLLTTNRVKDGKTYKRTKSQAEDDKITFSGSATRNRHHKQEKANNNR